MDDLDRLVHDLDGITSKAHRGIVAATKFSAHAAKEQARENASGSRWLPHLPRTITYDVDAGVDEIRASVGPENRGQGSLGHIFEYGSPTSGAHLPVNQAVDGEMDDYEAALAKVAGGLL